MTRILTIRIAGILREFRKKKRALESLGELERPGLRLSADRSAEEIVGHKSDNFPANVPTRSSSLCRCDMKSGRRINA